MMLVLWTLAVPACSYLMAFALIMGAGIAIFNRPAWYPRWKR